MTNEQKPLRIIELIAENVKRLRAVTIRPNGSTVLIGGQNAQGKSSLLDAIEMALGGAKTIPQEPVRHGARKARIVADLGEIVVERTFTAKGTELVVRNKEGIPQASPQKLLDSLTAKVTFDPFAFSRMDAPKQDELLKKMIGLDFSDLEAARAKVYEKRADVNREVKRLDALVDSTDWHADAPKQVVDVAALMEKIQLHRNAVGSRNTLKAVIDGDRAKLSFHDEQIARLERELVELKTKRAELAADIETRDLALPSEPEPIDAVQEQVRTAEATNAKVRSNADKTRLERDLKARADEAEELTGAIESIDKEKAERLAAAKFPIAGLGFDDSGPTFNEVPLAQASQAERLRLSVAIGAALNPRAKIMLIREGSLLDEKSLALLSEFAEQSGAQCWIERVTGPGGAPGHIIIEDGCVVGEEENGDENQATLANVG